MILTPKLIRKLEAEVDKTNLSPYDKTELKSYVSGHAAEVQFKEKYKDIGQLVLHIRNDVQIPGGALFRYVFPNRVHRTTSLYYEDCNENRHYNEDQDEPLSASKPSAEDAKINIGSWLDETIVGMSISKIIKKIPDNLTEYELWFKLCDLSMTRLDNPISDPLHLIALVVTPYFNPETGDMQPVYKNITHFILDNPQLSEKKVRSFYEALKAELKRWANKQYEKFRVNKIQRG
ncbi:MAG TPA: hypothetical protein VIH86_06495 [Puia sp.]